MNGMNKNDETPSNSHFDPCHSEGIPGGCDSCSHRDECIPAATDDDFFRDPMEPHPDEQSVNIRQPQQLTLFDVNEYLANEATDDDDDDDEPLGSFVVQIGEQLTLFNLDDDDDDDDDDDWVDMSKSYVHLEGQGNAERVPLAEFNAGYQDFIRIRTVKEVVDHTEILAPFDGPVQVAFIHGTLYIATPEQLATLIETATFVDGLDLASDDPGEGW